MAFAFFTFSFFYSIILKMRMHVLFRVKVVCFVRAESLRNFLGYAKMELIESAGGIHGENL